MSPGLIPREWSSSSPGVRGTIPGNSQRGVVGHQFPRRRQRRSWRPGITPDTGGEWSQRPGITPDTGVGVVLEAWCYTRAAGTEVIHVAATGFQGISDCVALYNSPRIWQRLAQYQWLLEASISKGRCHQYQGSVGDGSDCYTGIQSSHGVINLHFVYTLVTVLVCL